MDPLTIFAALGPLAVDLGKSLIGKFISNDGYKPVNVDEYVRMKELDLKLFTAMNEAGGSNPSYPWVEAVVRLMRPSIAIAVMGTWSYLQVVGKSSDSIDNFAAAIGFYLFADRTLFHLRKKTP
jgi:hypothetical protein